MSAAGHSRPLLAARTSSGEPIQDGGNTPPAPNRPPHTGRPKRTLIESACSACRRRKSRCDGVRPACSRCQNLRTECHYEAEEGESRWSALRRRNQLLEQERDHLRELLSFVQTRPEIEAHEIFQRIRITSYDDLFLLLRQIRESMLGIQPNIQQPLPSPVMASSAEQQRLPPINTILDVPSHPAHAVRPAPPPHLTHSHSLSSEESTGRAPSIPDLPPGMSSNIHPALQAMDSNMHGRHHGFAATPPLGGATPLVGPKPPLYSEDSAESSVGSANMSDPTKSYQTP